MSLLERAVREYRSSPVIHDLVHSQRPPSPDAARPPADPKVTSLTAHRAQKQPGGEVQGSS
jgi:hypothetical protein